MLDAIRAEHPDAPAKEVGTEPALLDLGGDIAGNGISKLFLTIAAAFAAAERDRIREGGIQLAQLEQFGGSLRIFAQGGASQIK